MSSVVLDASAVLALVFGEAGADRVEQRLIGAAISAVNFSECLGKMAGKGVPPEDALLRLRKLRLSLLPFDEQAAVLAASLLPAVRGRDISFADRACLAAGLQRQALVVTAERFWPELGLAVEIECIRPTPPGGLAKQA